MIPRDPTFLSQILAISSKEPNKFKSKVKPKAELVKYGNMAMQNEHQDIAGICPERNTINRTNNKPLMGLEAPGL